MVVLVGVELMLGVGFCLGVVVAGAIMSLLVLTCVCSKACLKMLMFV